MRIYSIVLLLATCLASSVFAQNFSSIDGPANYMQLNSAKTDFEEVNYQVDEGYRFYHSDFDAECPWSVVSEAGENIYTKLDLSKSFAPTQLYILSPTLSLDTAGDYAYSQSVFGIANEEANPRAYAAFELKLVSGQAIDFNPDEFSELPVIKSAYFFTADTMDIAAENIVPQSVGNYYFVLHVTAAGGIGDNATLLSVGFKENTVINTLGDPAAIDNTLAQDIKLYPNPSSDNITIANYSGRIAIYNSLGMMLVEKENYGGESLDVSHLASGIYIVNGDQLATRFIKR